MKRQILCMECYEKFSSKNCNPYPGEHLKAIHGTAKDLFCCDMCGKPIQKGDECVAESVWADYGGIPYYEWEDEYIIFSRTK